MTRLCVIANANSVHTQRWVRAFATRDDYDVVLISPHRGPQASVELFGNARVYSLPAAPAPAKRRYLQVVLNYSWMRWHLNREKYDLVHVHQLPPAPMGLWLWRVRPLVVTVWGSDVLGIPGASRSRLAEWSRRFLLARATHITAASNFLAEGTREYARADIPISVVPFGVDTVKFRPRPEPQPSHDGVRLIFAKHLRPIYGLDYLLRALATVVKQSPEVSLLVLGEGSEKMALKELAKSLGVADHVSFVGRVSHAEIAQYYQQADIFVMPSLSESFGVAALEAQACGLPVVATNVGGIPEVVVHGETGMLVPPADSQALAEAVSKLVGDPELRVLLGRQAVDFVRRNFDWDDSVSQMDGVYRRVQLCTVMGSESA